MTRIIRRYQKSIAIAMLLLNFTGARAMAVTDTCGRCHILYGPSLSFKSIAKTILNQQWKKPVLPLSYGLPHTHGSGTDLESLARRRRLTPINLVPPVSIALANNTSRIDPMAATELPTDMSPVQPPHLYSKK